MECERCVADAADQPTRARIAVQRAMKEAAAVPSHLVSRLICTPTKVENVTGPFKQCDRRRRELQICDLQELVCKPSFNRLSSQQPLTPLERLSPSSDVSNSIISVLSRDGEMVLTV
jgi:hypothetical protein